MKNLGIMNVNKIILLFFILFSFHSFSQKKEDVYFFLEKNNPEYITPGIFDDKLDYINLVSRKEYEYHQKKVKEAKRKGKYYFDPNSGRDNLEIRVPTLTFEIISKKKIKITDYEMSKLKLIDYDWIKNNAWKKIGKQPHNFKDIYFVYKIEKDSFISYKVGMTLVEY